MAPASKAVIIRTPPSVFVIAMDTYEALRHCVKSDDPNLLNKFIRYLCGERVFGQSLTHCTLMQIEGALDDMGAETCDVVTEIKAMEDIDMIERRQQLYYGQQVCGKLPKPLTTIVLSFVSAPAPSRAKPTMFTFLEEYTDEIGRVWCWAPYTFEAWWGEVRD